MKRKIILAILAIVVFLMLTIIILDKFFNINGFLDKILYLLIIVLFILSILMYKEYSKKVPQKMEDKKEDEATGK